MATSNKGQMADNSLYKHGIQYIDSYGYIEKSKTILDITGNLRLIGDTGTGKTTLVHRLAELYNLPLYETVLTRDTTRWDLLATDTLSKGETETRIGIILDWLQNPDGGIAYMDGFNYAEPSIISLLESLADFRGSVWIPELKQTFYRSAKHFLVISYNPSEKAGYSGTFLENIATIRRFEGLRVNYISPMHERKLIQDHAGKDVQTGYKFAAKWVEIGKKTRQMYKDSKLRTPLTTGNLINYAKFYAKGMAEDDILEIASSLYPEDEIETFKKCFEDSKDIDLNKIKDAMNASQTS